MNIEEKSKTINNDLNLQNNYILTGDSRIKEMTKKKSFKRYKFHMFHHNNVLNQIKSTGIDMNLMDNVLNSNDALILQLLKNNDESAVRRNISKAFSELIKSNSKKNENNALNIIQSYYETYAKKYKINLKKEKTQVNTEIKFKKDHPKLTTVSSINNENNKINIIGNPKQKRRYSLNNENKNPFVFPIKLDDFTKKKYIIKTKGRSSADLSSKKGKNYLSFIEGNNMSLPFVIQNINDKNNNIFKRLSVPTYLPGAKRSRSTLDILSGNNNNNVLFFNNKKSIFKNTLTNIKNYNKDLYIRNKKKPNLLYKNKIIYNRNFSEFNQTTHIKGSVNFKKMLSRDYLNRLKAEKADGVYSTATPNYELVEPKCIMKVSYSNKKHKVQNQSFKGLGAEATIDMNKLFFKYNNHNPPKGFHFEKMAGRGHSFENKLPMFMINQVDRNSFTTFNEKNLKMNSYSNGQLKQLISCLNERKSFNFKLNEKKEEETEDKKNFENFAKQIFEKGITSNDENKSVDEETALENRFISSIPFRVNSLFKNFMAEYNRKSSFPEKIDGITFKNFKIANKIRAKKLI